jgi:hypothetical protein
MKKCRLSRSRIGAGAAALSLGLLLGGCAENNDLTRAVGWFRPQAGGPPQTTVLVLPDDPSSLGTEGVEGTLRNAMDLAKAKRFAESRVVLDNLASQFPPDSDFWRSIKCAEMVLALRGNDLPALIESAEAVERNLKDTLRPPGECVAQLSIARALRGQQLPLNAPESLASTLQGVPKPREVRAAQTDVPARSIDAQSMRPVTR